LSVLIVNTSLPSVAKDDLLKGKSPEFRLLYGVYLLHKFHAEFPKHLNGKM
jgi:hypothetical protein